MNLHVTNLTKSKKTSDERGISQFNHFSISLRSLMTIRWRGYTRQDGLYVFGNEWYIYISLKLMIIGGNWSKMQVNSLT